MPAKRATKRMSQEAMGRRLSDRLAMYAGLFVLAIFIVHPLIFTNHYFNITETKLWSFITILCVSLGLMVCAAVYTLMLGYAPKLNVKERLKSLRPYEVAILAYWVVILISAFTADDMRVAFMGFGARNEGFFMQSGYILAFLVVARFYRPRLRDLTIFCAVAAAVALYGICQYYGNDFLQINGNEPVMGPKMVFFSTMSNKNVISTYLCLALPVSAVMFVQHEGRLRWAFLGFAWVIFFMLLQGDTDSGYVGIIGALGLTFPFVAKDRKSAAKLLLLLAGCAMLAWLFGLLYSSVAEGSPPQMAGVLAYMPWLALALCAVSAALWFVKIPQAPKKVWRIVWMGVLVVVLIAGIVALPILAEKTGNNVLVDASELLKGNMDDHMGSGRGFAWKRALELASEQPIIGHGPDNFAYNYYARYSQESMDVMGVVFDKVHNEFLQVLVDAGALGLLCWLAFFALILWGSRKYLENPAILGICVAVVAFLIQAFFNFSTPFAHPVVWTLLGFLGALLRDARAKEPLPDATKETKAA